MLQFGYFSINRLNLALVVALIIGSQKRKKKAIQFCIQIIPCDFALCNIEIIDAFGIAVLLTKKYLYVA